MSYDLYLFRPIPGESPMVTALALLQAEDEMNGEGEMFYGERGPIEEVKDQIKERLASKLLAANPRLSRWKYDYVAIANMYDITPEEARIRHRNIEINAPDNGNGIQIEMFDDTVSVAVPYWHEGNEAEKVFKEIWQYLTLLYDEGFVAYDQQIDGILDLDKDFETVVNVYRSISG